MLYCERCNLLYEGDTCPQCRKANGRAPKDDDLCLVAERGQIEADMLADVLDQNGIKSLLRGERGAGLSMYTGLMLESFRVFVNYSDYQQAREIVEAFFVPMEQDEEGEGDEPDDDQE